MAASRFQPLELGAYVFAVALADQDGQGGAHIIDFPTLYPVARRQVVRMLELQAAAAQLPSGDIRASGTRGLTPRV